MDAFFRFWEGGSGILAERFRGWKPLSRFYLLKILAAGRALLIVGRQVPIASCQMRREIFLPSLIYGEHHFSWRAMGR
jgi:hypothetical protein